MNNYKKLSALYYELDELLHIKRNISEAKINPQNKDHIFKLDMRPRYNSLSIMGCKIKHKIELLNIVDNEIKQRQLDISQLLSEK